MTAKLLAASTCVFICLSAAIAQAETYLCVAEAAGGVAFVNERWIGMSFRVNDEKYIVTSKDMKNYNIRKIGGTYDYLTCERQYFETRPSSRLLCGGLGFGAIFDFTTNRFQYYYGLGFLDGKDTGDTPYITVAKCNKIEL